MNIIIIGNIIMIIINSIIVIIKGNEYLNGLILSLM